jgi:hypothetical protein
MTTTPENRINIHSSASTPVWISAENLDTLRVKVADDPVLWALLLDRDFNMAKLARDPVTPSRMLTNREVDEMIIRGDRIPAALLPQGFNINEAEGRVAWREGRDSGDHGFGDALAAEEFKRGWHGARLRGEEKPGGSD